MSPEISDPADLDRRERHGRCAAPDCDACDPADITLANAIPSPEPEPEPVVSGTFAIFQDGRGGFVVVADTGTGPTRRHIPAAIVKMVTGGGLLGKRFGGLLGER